QLYVALLGSTTGWSEKIAIGTEMVFSVHRGRMRLQVIPPSRLVRRLPPPAGRRALTRIVAEPSLFSWVNGSAMMLYPIGLFANVVSIPAMATPMPLAGSLTLRNAMPA